MRFKEIVDEAGLIGKLGSAVGKVAKGVGTAAGVAAGAAQQFKQGAEKWKGTGMLGRPRGGSEPAQPQSKDSAPSALQDVDTNALKQILDAAAQGKQIEDPRLLRIAQQIQQKL
jgi:hypothetical protein